MVTAGEVVMLGNWRFGRRHFLDGLTFLLLTLTGVRAERGGGAACHVESQTRVRAGKKVQLWGIFFLLDQTSR